MSEFLSYRSMGSVRFLIQFLTSRCGVNLWVFVSQRPVSGGPSPTLMSRNKKRNVASSAHSAHTRSPMWAGRRRIYVIAGGFRGFDREQTETTSSRQPPSMPLLPFVPLPSSCSSISVHSHNSGIHPGSVWCWVVDG